MNCVRLLETRNVTGCIYKIFQIKDYTSPTIEHAMAVASGVSLENKNDLMELYPEHEQELLFHFRDEIYQLRNDNRKFIFIMDISDFPYISCYIDPSNNKFATDTSRFGSDIQSLWTAYNSSKVITIVVNSHLPFTGLKHTDFQ